MYDNLLQPPPTLSDELLSEAFEQFAKDFECDLPNLIKGYHYPIYKDGFKIGKYLDDLGWDITAADVEKLDTLQDLATEALINARKKWVEDNNIQPQFEVGTMLTNGIITEISQLMPAYYLVKEFDKNTKNRLLVKFEDAILAK